MSSCHDRLRRAAALLLASGLAAAAAAQGAYSGIGRTATPKEVQAWDIDVRPDFKGLPPGAGSVAKGQDVWEGQCASCHGVFGESNQVFSPLVGGTTAEDVKTGRVARLLDPSFPGRTTLMKVATVSTLWDYINRAMPWTAPKSLSTDEVYAVTAYLLNLGGVVPDDFVLSDATIAQAQARMPNRNGFTTDHALWPGKALPTRPQPDVPATACMKDCAAEPRVASFLPDHARNNNGNLADQQRLVGPQRGADTRPAAVATPVAATRVASAAPAPAMSSGPADPASGNPPLAAGQGLFLAQKHGCTACHGVEGRIVGPGFREIASRHAGRTDAQAYLAGKIQSGGQGVWGAIPMPAQSAPAPDIALLARWLAAGAAH